MIDDLVEKLRRGDLLSMYEQAQFAAEVDRLRALPLDGLAGAPATPAPDMVLETTAWLIELRDRTPAWWSLTLPEEEDGHGWTTDSLKALRFARREDAEAYITDVGWTRAFASEHIWCDPPATPAPDMVLVMDRQKLGEMIYRAMYEHQGGKWEAVETRGVWFAAADRLQATLAATPAPQQGEESP